MAWQDIRHVRIKKVVLERADLAVVTTTERWSNQVSLSQEEKRKPPPRDGEERRDL